MQTFALKERTIKSLHNFIMTGEPLKQFRKVRNTSFPKLKKQHNFEKISKILLNVKIGAVLLNT